MATTSNYSWTTPDDTDLVKDGASAIRTLGSAIDTTVFNNAGAAVAKSTVDAKGDLIVGTANDTVGRLAVGTDGYTLVADSSVSPTGLKWAVDPVADVITTAGDLIYGTAADTVARLGIGTAGQVLKVNSGATAPEWGAVAGGGKVLQVVSASTTTFTNSSSSTYADTALSATITPSSATSQVLVLVTQNGCGKDNVNATSALNLRLLRGATVLQVFGFAVAYTGQAMANYVGSTATSYLDSPATTSATTYKTQLASNANNLTAFVNVGGENSTITLLEIGA